MSTDLIDKVNCPIGLFDSGVGGTSIWKEVIQLLPYEDTIYLADSINAPYGSKHKDQIIELCIKNVELLRSMGCKLIIVACNTATTNAIKHLRSNYDLPFVGIEPAIKPASLATKTNRIGILATKGTLDSELFHTTSQTWLDKVEVVKQRGTGIVELIESGKLNSQEMTSLLKKYAQVFLNAEVDHLVLGCSHYPYLIPQLKALLPKNITIIDSGLAVAKQTKHLLKEENILQTKAKKASHQFYTNAATRTLHSLVGSSVDVEYMDF